MGVMLVLFSSYILRPRAAALGIDSAIVGACILVGAILYIVGWHKPRMGTDKAEVSVQNSEPKNSTAQEYAKYLVYIALVAFAAYFGWLMATSR